MLPRFFRRYIFPVATLAGSIIGVGFLSLPYIASKVGFWPMIAYFVGITALVTYIHILFGRISLKTPDFKRWPGFIGHYFGQRMKMLMLATMTFGSSGVLLAYVIVGSEFLKTLVQPALGGEILPYALFYVLAASFFIYFGVSIISRVDFTALSLLAVILLVIFIKGFSHLKIDNWFFGTLAAGDWKTAFLPYGALMFSLWGVGMIPEIEEMVRGNKKNLQKIIAFSVLLAAVFYLIFTLVVLGITGHAATPESLLGLGKFLHPAAASLALCMGIITTFIAFVAQGLLLKKMLMYDMKVAEFPAWVFVCFTPFILFLAGVNSFIQIISFIGGFLLGIDGILILLMYRKIGGRRWIAYPLMTVFILGMIYEMVFSIR